MVLLGSPMPWVSTPVGQVSGFLGGGLWTFYAAMLGFAGVLVPFAKASIAQAAILCLAALGLAGWQVAHVWNLVGFGGWSPGVGLVFVIGGGALAGAAVRRMLAQLRGVEG
ncbi:MAG: hypothetical protein CMH83_11115 [Nocardioides sp.]|nr:hypothetical protein [Nocardioides sp.]